MIHQGFTEYITDSFQMECHEYHDAAVVVPAMCHLMCHTWCTFPKLIQCHRNRTGTCDAELDAVSCSPYSRIGRCRSCICMVCVLGALY